MDYPIHIDTISMELFMMYFSGHQSNFLQNDVFTSLNIVFTLANNADHNKMHPYVVFQLILTVCQRSRCSGTQNVKG